MEVIILGTIVCVILCLDITHVLQSMISQPIFSCTILGLIFGELEIGLTAGLIFEVSFLKGIPVGAASFPENSIGSLATTIYWLAINSNYLLHWEIFIPFGIFLGLSVSSIGKHITTFHRKHNTKYQYEIENKIKNGNFGNGDIFLRIMRSWFHYGVLVYLLVFLSTFIFYVFSIKMSTYFILLFSNSTKFMWVSIFLLMGFARIMNQYIKFKRIKKNG